MRIIDAATVRSLLPMSEAIRLMREVFENKKSAAQPLRTVIQSEALPGLAVVKPAALGSPPGLGVKLVSIFPGNEALGLAAVQGAVLLLDPVTGVPSALMDAAVVTEIRTAAASAVATDLLARPGGAALAILGAGVQGRAHLEAIPVVRDVGEVHLWSRTRGRAESLAEDPAFGSFDIRVHATAAEAAGVADIICTCTSSPSPILSAAAVRPGAHVNAVGAFQPDTRELESEVVRSARVFVDEREAAEAEAGDLLLAGVEPAGELAELVGGSVEGRQTAEQVTLFKSLGLAIEDVAAAVHVAAAAEQSGAGIEVSFP